MCRRVARSGTSLAREEENAKFSVQLERYLLLLSSFPTVPGRESRPAGLSWKPVGCGTAEAASSREWSDIVDA